MIHRLEIWIYVAKILESVRVYLSNIWAPMSPNIFTVLYFYSSISFKDTTRYQAKSLYEVCIGVKNSNPFSVPEYSTIDITRLTNSIYVHFHPHGNALVPTNSRLFLRTKTMPYTIYVRGKSGKEHDLITRTAT